MPNLLKIDASPRGSYSISRALGTSFAEQWRKFHPGQEVAERDLTTTELPFIELPWIMGAYSDLSTHDAAQRAALAIGNDLIAELRGADEWLIATPMYNFAVPGRLKAYIDHVVRTGVTLNVTNEGRFTSLLGEKKATVIVVSAGDYSPGSPNEALDQVTPYLRALLTTLGVMDLRFVQVGSTWQVDRGVVDRATFLANFSDQITGLAGTSFN